MLGVKTGWGEKLAHMPGSPVMMRPAPRPTRTAAETRAPQELSGKQKALLGQISGAIFGARPLFLGTEVVRMYAKLPGVLGRQKPPADAWLIWFAKTDLHLLVQVESGHLFVGLCQSDEGVYMVCQPLHDYAAERELSVHQLHDMVVAIRGHIDKL